MCWGDELGNCQADGKTPLYYCNRWDCQYCLAKKLYWLREQVITLALELTFTPTWFLTFKGFENAPQADDFIKYLIQCEKSRKTPHSAKFEYFYVIANHEFSGWHIHLLTNRRLHGHAAYCEPVGNLKFSCLYLVKNLLRSARADYGRVRRYGASRLLYKRNAKKEFKNRLKHWRLIVQVSLVQAVINLMSHWSYPLPYRVNLGYATITQALRNYRGTIEELTYRKPRDDLIGEWEWTSKLVRNIHAVAV